MGHDVSVAVLPNDFLPHRGQAQQRYCSSCSSLLLTDCFPFIFYQTCFLLYRSVVLLLLCFLYVDDSDRRISLIPYLSTVALLPIAYTVLLFCGG